MRTNRCKTCGIEIGYYVEEKDAYCDTHNPKQQKLFSNEKRKINTEELEVPVCVSFGGQQ